MISIYFLTVHWVVVNDLSGKNEFTVDAPFEVNVSSNTSATPEPASWLLPGTGLAVAGLLRRRILTCTLGD